jgi:hypothetical protein
MMAQQNGSSPATGASTVPSPQQPQLMAMPGFMPPGAMAPGDATNQFAQHQQQQQYGFFPTMPAMVYPQYPATQMNQ